MAEFELLGGGGAEAQFQQGLAYLFKQISPGLVQPGVLVGLAVTQMTSASTGVFVAAGACVAQDTVLNGVTELVNNSQKTQDVLVANPASANPRNDIVVFDAATKTIRVITGTPNVTPTDPTVPATAVPLARLRILGSATTIPTAQIDDLRVFTGLATQGRSTSAFVPTASFYDCPSLSYTLNGTVASSTPGLNTVLEGGHVTLNGNIRRTGANFSSADTLLGNISNAAHRPTDVQRGLVNTGSGIVTLMVLPTGDVWLVQATMNTNQSVVPHLTWPAP